MIQNKYDLTMYLAEDMRFYHEYSLKDRLICMLTRDPVYEIVRYVNSLRKEEYYFNCEHNLWGKISYLFYMRKKNNIGIRLGIKIPRNTFDAGLTIYHHGEIIVNEGVKVGRYASLHGGNCLGNNGKTDLSPDIGDFLDMGIGSKIIGGIHLGNNVCIGANAVVTHSELDNDITLVGIPARKLQKRISYEESN